MELAKRGSACLSILTQVLLDRCAEARFPCLRDIADEGFCKEFVPCVLGESEGSIASANSLVSLVRVASPSSCSRIRCISCCFGALY